LSDADAHVERERERQQERLERLRRQKKFLAQNRTEQAMKLLEKALEMDRV
jgi:Tfp pilus assembly protein PilF